MTWEEEKSYTRRRADELGREMEAALETRDRERFLEAHTASMRWMKKKLRAEYYRRFLQMEIERSERS